MTHYLRFTRDMHSGVRRQDLLHKRRGGTGHSNDEDRFVALIARPRQGAQPLAREISDEGVDCAFCWSGS